MSPFHGKVRIRICGVLLQENKLLLVKHRGLGSAGFFWSPPGGGIEFGESYQQALEREFWEETGLMVKTGDFLAFHEHIDQHFHALELFFSLSANGGKLMTGTEPESSDEGPVLEDVRWFSLAEIESMPPETIHSICRSLFRID